MRSKVLPLILPPKSCAELERQARAQDRDPLQQARFILKRALEDRSAGTIPTDDRQQTVAAAGSRG